MSQLPERWDDGEETGSQIDRYRWRGLDLTPAERQQRRSNRRWMVGISAVSIAILVSALVATAVYNANEPSGPAIRAPRGYQALNDGYFSYVVPTSWSNNPTLTDQAGDVDTSGPSGFAGEHIGYRLSAPVLDEPQPASLQAFGQGKPTPYQLGNGHPISVRGAAAAFSYVVTRPTGFQAVAIDAWDARADVELWLMVQAPPEQMPEIISSLRA